MLHVPKGSLHTVLGVWGHREVQVSPPHTAQGSEAIPGGCWAPHLLSERPLCGQAAPPTPVPIPRAAGSGASSASRPLGVRPSSGPSPSSSDTSRISSTVSGKLMRYLSLTGCGTRGQSEQASHYCSATRSSCPHARALGLHSGKPLPQARPQPLPGALCLDKDSRPLPG